MKHERITVDEYMDEFYRLARFAPGLVPMEASRAWKFEKWLRPDIRDKMSGTEWTNLRDACVEAFR